MRAVVVMNRCACRVVLLVLFATYIGCRPALQSTGSDEPVGTSLDASSAVALDPKAVEQMTDYEKKVLALGGRPKLHLDFSGSKVTDDDLAKLEVLPMVTSMDLSYTNITDRGIEHLKKYPQLEKLTIVAAPISDASIEHFKGMKNLWVVDLDGTKVSHAGGMQLIKFLAPRANERLYRPKPGRPVRH